MNKNRIIIIAVIAVLVIILFGIYNSIVKLNEQVNREWANVENVYQRRADLIPNLVNTVKGYKDYEQETLIRVVEARSKATSVTIDAKNMTEDDLKRFQAAQGELSSALSRLLAITENYPDLKANQSFLDLQSQLEGTENRITVERRKFNETVTKYNTKILSFPGSIYAAIFGFSKRPYFEAEEGTEKVPTVQF
jgi:LemA protein